MEGTANAKALGKKYVSGACKQWQGGQCGFPGVTESKIGSKWGQEVNRAFIVQTWLLFWMSWEALRRF